MAAEKIIFRPEFVVRTSGRDYVVAASEDQVIALRGRDFAAVAALVTEADSRDAVLQCRSLPSDHIATAVASFENAGLLTRSESNMQPEAAYWGLLHRDASECDQQLRAAIVTITGVGGAGSATLVDAFGAICTGAPGGRVLDIVVAADYLHPDLEAINATALENGRVWMLVRPTGASGWIGPLFVPGRTACWKCMSSWMEQNGWMPDSAFASTVFTTAALEMFAANEASKYLAMGQNGNIEGVLCSVDTRTLSVAKHPVLARPQCPACRSVRRATVAVDDLLSPITGVIAYRRLSYSRPGFVIADARGSRQVCRDARDRYFRVPADRSTGTGLTPEEALARCTSESVERYSAQFHGDEDCTRGSFADVCPEAIHPNSLMLFSEFNFASREQANLTIGGKHFIPERFDERRDTAWIVASALNGGPDHLAPAGCCFRGYNAPDMVCDSNGCASATDEEQAILSGLLELVERDAVALWWYNRVRRPAVSVTGLSPAIDLLVKFFAERDRSVHVLDLTTEFRIPVYAAISMTAAGEAPVVGTAAGPDASSAIWKALAECAATLEALDTFSGEAQTPDEHAQLRWFRTANGQDCGYLLPSGESLQEPATGTVSLSTAVTRLDEAAVDSFFIRLTRPELGSPTVRVLAPGLRPWLMRYAPGRLYETPVRLGWYASTNGEDALNPFPYPF